MKEKPAIVIPLDGSETATVALGAAQAMANIMNGVLHVVHVGESAVPQEELLEKLHVDKMAAKNFVLHQMSGDVVQSVLWFASSIEARMIVMSSHGWTFNPEYLAGHVTLDMIMHATIPVLIIRPGLEVVPGATWRPTRMLVPLDGTPESAAVLKQVFDMVLDIARLVGMGIDVLHIAVVGQKQPAGAGALTTPRYLDYPQYEWPSWATEFRERFMHVPPDVKLRLFHREGDPPDVMLEFAEENDEDLILLSWHGHLEKKRGERIKGVLRRTERPVLLMRSDIVSQ